MSVILTSVADHFHPIWTNIFFYLFAVSSILFFVIIRVCTKRIAAKNAETKQVQQQYSAKFDAIRKDHEETLEKVRGEMLKKEEDATRQWQEAEKESMLVLNRMTQLLELSENFGRVESNKILAKIEELKELFNNNLDLKN